MSIRFANIYLQKEDSTLEQSVRSFLNTRIDTQTVFSEKLLLNVANEIKKIFNFFQVDLPYYYYSEENKYLIDVIINDFYSWEKSFGNEQLRIPDILRIKYEAYKKEIENYKGEFDFKKGYWSATGLNQNNLEEVFFVDDVDNHIEPLKKVIKKSSFIQERIDAVFLVGFSKKHEKDVNDILINLHNDKDHSIHNMASRTLLPKAMIDMVDVFDLCLDLLNHRNPFCISKGLGCLSIINLSANQKKTLAEKINTIMSFKKNEQEIISFYAKEVLNRL